MKKVYILSFVFAALFLLFFAFSSSIFAADSECSPPFSDYVGSYSSKSSCEAEAPFCAQSGSTWYGYNSSKVGDSCTLDASGSAGTCNAQGECIIVGECDPIWNCDFWEPSESEKPCGQSFTQTRVCADAANCGTNEGKPTESQVAIGTSCPSGQSCQGGICTGGSAPPPADKGNNNNGGTGIINLKDLNPLNAENVQEVIEAISNFIWSLAVAIAPIMFLIAGFLFITSGGDPGRARTAKNLFLYTVIGLAIVLLASGLYQVIKSILGG